VPPPYIDLDSGAKPSVDAAGISQNHSGRPILDA
jgi:hypothetical protein